MRWEWPTKPPFGRWRDILFYWLLFTAILFLMMWAGMGNPRWGLWADVDTPCHSSMC
jgi:hypothetical protein